MMSLYQILSILSGASIIIFVFMCIYAFIVSEKETKVKTHNPDVAKESHKADVAKESETIAKKQLIDCCQLAQNNPNLGVFQIFDEKENIVVFNGIIYQ